MDAKRVTKARHAPALQADARRAAEGSHERGTGEVYDAHPLAATVLMTEFFMQYLRNLHRVFGGDLTLALVLGEIGQANTRRFVQSMHPDGLPVWMMDGDVGSADLRGCNGLSVSMASGVARETVRRKIAELHSRGWIEPHPEGGWVATTKASEQFTPEFNRDSCRLLLQTARRIEALGTD